MQEKYKNNILTGRSALYGMMNGINIVTNAVRYTYGAGGVNAAIEVDEYPFHMVSNDAQSMVQPMWMQESLERMALSFIKELSDKAHKDSGDGRKTTLIINDAIIRHGYEMNKSGMEIKRSLDETIPVIEKHIDDHKKEITVDEVYKVATISSESKELGKIIGEIYQKVGKDGIIDVEGSNTPRHEVSYNLDGVRFKDAVMLSPFMAHDEQALKDKAKERKAIYLNPLVLVTKRKINHINDIEPLLKLMTQQGKKDLIVFTDDMDSGVASLLVRSHLEKVFNILIIKAPVLWKNWAFDDFAKVTGSTIVEDSTGVNFKNLQVKHLGTCDKIVVDENETLVIGGKDISEHIAELNKGDNDSRLRASFLSTKTAVLRVGANNESELSYLRLKAQDAVNASRLALIDGVVAGGAISLLNASKGLPDTIGGKIMAQALKEPSKQICINSNLDFTKITDNKGYNANTGELVDMFEAGIIDSAKVIKNAVRNAVALASTVLTTGVVITKPPKSPEQIAYEMLQTQGKRF